MRFRQAGSVARKGKGKSIGVSKGKGKQVMPAASAAESTTSGGASYYYNKMKK